MFFDEHTDLGDMTAEPTLDCVDQNETVDEDEELYSHETDGMSSGNESDESTQLPDSVTYSLRIPDPLCMKLDDLISRGLLSSDGILYKHVHDVVECIYNPLHKYHPDVVEFFNTVQHLGGQATVNFLRGPMFTGSGSGIKKRNAADCRMNFGGPCTKTRRKKQSGYTTKSGIIKELSLAHYKLASCKNEDSYLLSNALVQVTPCVPSNDGNPLKPAIEFDSQFKRNVDLDIAVI